MKSVILLHGALGSAEQLIPLEKLLQSNYKVYRLNFEGHGSIVSDNPFSIDLFVTNLRHFIHQNHLENVFIFGYSMGGYVALKLAVTEPNLISGIVTLGTKFDWNPDSAEREAKLLNAEKLEEKVPAFAASLKKLHGEHSWKVVLSKTADMMLRLGAGEASEPAYFKEVKIPVLLGLGDRDTMVTEDETKTILNQIPGAKFCMLENTIHPIEKVMPEKIATVITDFFGS